MNRMWMGAERLIPQEEVLDPGSSGGGGGSGDPPNPASPTPASNPSPTGTESPFRGTPFEGMTADEVARKYALMESTVREQGRALNDLSNRPAAPATPVAPVTPKDDEVDAQTFFADPNKVLKARDERLISKLTEHMERIISPFKQSLSVSAVQQAWDEVKEMYPDLMEYRSYIETLLQRQGITEPNAGTIRLLYLSAKDELSRSGRTNVQKPETTTTAAPAARPAPPQHRASGQPINPTPSGKPARRSLTENERRLARENRMTDEQFLDWLEEEEENVLASKIGATK